MIQPQISEQNKRLIANKESLNTNQGPLILQAYSLGTETWQILPNFFLSQEKIGNFLFETITKIKVKADKGCNGFYQIKLTVHQKDHFICVSAKDQTLVLSELLKGKLFKTINTRHEQQSFINLCEGVVFKKEFFMFGWSECYLFISKAGLTCAKTKEDEAEFYINKLRQIWTRFQCIENNKFVIFKTKHRLIKYEFAVPLKNALKWSKAFCSLLEYQ